MKCQYDNKNQHERETGRKEYEKAKAKSEKCTHIKIEMEINELTKFFQSDGPIVK